MPDFKLFTLQEAERTCRWCGGSWSDLTVEYPAWRAAVGRFELLTVRGKSRLG